MSIPSSYLHFAICLSSLNWLTFVEAMKKKSSSFFSIHGVEHIGTEMSAVMWYTIVYIYVKL